MAGEPRAARGTGRARGGGARLRRSGLGSARRGGARHGRGSGAGGGAGDRARAPSVPGAGALAEGWGPAPCLGSGLPLVLCGPGGSPRRPRGPQRPETHGSLCSWCR